MKVKKNNQFVVSFNPKEIKKLKSIMDKISNRKIGFISDSLSETEHSLVNKLAQVLKEPTSHKS
jgi:hypothetical protein